MSALRLAHRGDWRVAPENSIAALTAAMRIRGCDGIEFDVRASRDGRAIVLHDADLARVHGHAAPARTLTAEELAALGVPTLVATLAALDDKPFLDVEMKEWVPDAIGALEGARGGTGSLERAVVSSFDAAILGELNRLRPKWSTWLNSVRIDSSVLDEARRLGCRGISAEWHAISPRGLREAAAAGVTVAAWTVRRPSTYRRLDRLGVTAICAEGAALLA